ncbi:hypothetical protein DL93DRAFT_2164111 [Clavulina sp. PMI_390]|nr:hypothetical protein DL93DRAFT_2164111 [Clavulina sp. PMI_390]
MADSDSLFYLKNQFYLGNYRAVAQNPVPPKSSIEYLPTLLYTARSLIALNESARVLSFVEADVEPAVRAVRALASYLETKKSGGSVDAILDELRDLTIEAEAAAEEATSSYQEGADVGVVRVAAGTAFIEEGEIEEALTTLGAGTGVKDLECVYLIVQIYLSINRTELAKKEIAAAKTNIPAASDSVLFALAEAALGLAAGGGALVSAYHIYDEQVSAPGSSQNANIIASKGVAELLRGHLTEASASFDEALGLNETCGDALVGRAVIKQLSGKQEDADAAYAALQSALPTHPYLQEIAAKSALFDQLKVNYAASKA